MKRFVLLAVLCPLSIEAQSGSGIGVFVSRDGSLPNTPNLAGLELRSSQGPLALRIAGAAGPVFPSLGVEPGADGERRFVGSADLDLMLDLGAMLGGSGGRGLALMPFVGLGIVGAGLPESEMESMTVWTYGGSLLMPLGSRMALQLEGRQRIPFAESASLLPAGFGRALEQRVGIVVRFGGGGSSRSSAASRASASAWGPAILFGTGASAGGSAAARRMRVAQTADTFVGTRYRYGGSAPNTGFDCSGFVRYVYARNGVTLPRTARDQASAGVRVAAGRAGLVTGDLMFFRLESSRIDHVAMYAGGGRIIHSSSSGGGVRYDEIDSARGRWLMGRLAGVRRVITN